MEQAEHQTIQIHLWPGSPMRATGTTYWMDGSYTIDPNFEAAPFETLGELSQRVRDAMEHQLSLW